MGFSKVFWEFSKIFLDDYIDRLELEGESKSYICIFLDDDIDRLELEGESKLYICIFLDADIDRL